MKPNIITEYHVFLASPGDMDAERRGVRKFFEDYNRHTAARWKLRFTVIDWENYSTFGIGRPQELITRQTLERFQESLALVIGLMGQRFGSPTGAHESGTEEEFDWALTAYLQTGFPEIKWFFRNIETFQAPPDPQKIADALDQWTKVRAFRERLETSTPPIYYGTFSDAAHFREVFRNDLSLWLNDERHAWHARYEHGPIVSSSDIIELPAAYFKSLAQEFESLDIAGIDNERAVDIPLDEVYVRLRVIKDEDSAAVDEDLDGGPIDIHTALGQYQRLVIVGDPGSGKSTFLKFIALMIARAKFQDEPGLAAARLNLHPPLPVPFFVSLWDLSDFIKHSGQATENAISDFIVSRAEEKGATLSRKTLEEMLAHGSCCLLFDGLDEVPTEQGRALISRLVEKFVGRFEKNRFVVTSRGRGYTGGAILKGGFVRCDVQNFDESDRREFLKNWFAALLGVSREHVLNEGTPGRVAYDALSPAIESKDRIRSLAVNPLMMTVIAIVHWNRKRLPDQRVDLYDECVDVLLGQRKAAERTVRYSAAEVLNEETESEVQYDRAWTRKRFAEIALRILESGSDEITRDVVIGLLQQRFRDRLGATDERAAIEAERFLDSQELRSGLLVSRRSHSCRFVHLTFQEYLAAWSLAPQSLNVIKSTIAPHLRDPQWFEPLQLLGGELARNSDEKLDEYVSYLLGTMGTTIAEQAPIIALCANILQDIKGVADIKAQTQESYTEALKGTLHAFKPGSGVPTKIQLEVLRALIPLGASVKEHLIEATKSAYFPVRSQAINLLVPHLPDADLFSMDHILEDRSQDPIIVYMSALFERDGKRAMELIAAQADKANLNYKAFKAFVIACFEYESQLDIEDIKRVGGKLIKICSHSEIRNVLYSSNAIFRSNKLKEAMKFWSLEAQSSSIRSLIFQTLILNSALALIDLKILSSTLTPYYLYINPSLPITSEWVEHCSERLNEDKEKIWERFERLATFLPITLEH
jgi:energy-coupling factor transporter ATP-binding protein EcfA2